MKIFLVCNEDGNVTNVVLGKTFEEVYKETVGLNNGELLIEIDRESLIKMNNLLKRVKIGA